MNNLSKNITIVSCSKELYNEDSFSYVRIDFHKDLTKYLLSGYIVKGFVFHEIIYYNGRVAGGTEIYSSYNKINPLDLSYHVKIVEKMNTNIKIIFH